MNMYVVKARRCARISPKEAWTFFCAPIFSSGQILTFAAASIGLSIILQTASAAERDVQAAQWAISVQAFGYALVGWAIISMICAPFVTVKKDRERGKWHGSKFVYHQPLLVATIFCSYEHRKQVYDFQVKDAEDESFVYLTVEMDRPVSGVACQVGGMIFTSTSHGTGSWKQFRLQKNRKASLMLHAPNSLKLDAPGRFHDFVARIYCHEFDVKYE